MELDLLKSEVDVLKKAWHEVWRVMRQAGLTCRRKRRMVHTTNSKYSYQIYPNLVKGLQVEAPKRCWVSDLTYVRLPEGFVYLALLPEERHKGITVRSFDGQLVVVLSPLIIAKWRVVISLVEFNSALFCERHTQIGVATSLFAR